MVTILQGLEDFVYLAPPLLMKSVCPQKAFACGEGGGQGVAIRDTVASVLKGRLSVTVQQVTLQLRMQ